MPFEFNWPIKDAPTQNLLPGPATEEPVSARCIRCRCEFLLSILVAWSGLTGWEEPNTKQKEGQEPSFPFSQKLSAAR